MAKQAGEQGKRGTLQRFDLSVDEVVSSLRLVETSQQGCLVFERIAMRLDFMQNLGDDLFGDV